MIDTEDDFEELTGPEAIQRALQEVDLDLLEASAKAELKKKKKSTRKTSVQTLQAIDGLRKSGVKPQELMVSKIPVVPPLFRPYAITGDTFTTGHSNELYRDLMESKKGFESIKETFGDDAAKEAGYNLYNATRALYGYGEAVNPKTKARGVTGFMSQILGGGSPKFSVPQRRLFSKTTDSVSRSVITIDPEMDIDQIGLPRHMAMEQYAPHVQRELVRQGYSNVDAITQIKDNGKAANKVLEDLVKTMPVVYSRAPAWHKYNVLGGWVKLTDGDSISTNPYVMAGLGGDFDGDTVTVHLPAMKESQDEAKNILMPSKMVLSTKREDTVVPTIKHEQILGLYAAKNKPSQNKFAFQTRQEAMQAIKKGEVRLSDDVEILDEIPAL
jgi:DNA-directed RNA polymerase subunit beta'